MGACTQDRGTAISRLLEAFSPGPEGDLRVHVRNFSNGSLRRRHVVNPARSHMAASTDRVLPLAYGLIWAIKIPDVRLRPPAAPACIWLDARTDCHPRDSGCGW